MQTEKQAINNIQHNQLIMNFLVVCYQKLTTLVNLCGHILGFTGRVHISEKAVLRYAQVYVELQTCMYMFICTRL